MHQRKGAYSSKKKKTHTGGSHSNGGLRRPGSAAASHQPRTASSTSATAHTPYFSKTLEQARNKTHGGKGEGRSRGASFSQEFNGDPFQSIRIRNESTEPHLLQANALLAAIPDLLRERGIDPSQEVVNPTHYFGILMVGLEERDRQPPETTGAILYLLNVLLPQLSKAVIQLKSEQIAGVLIDVLEKHADDAHISKHVLECSTTVLGSIAESSNNNIWTANSSAPNTTKLLQVLLVYSLDHRPRVRRAGQEGVRDILKGLYEHSVTLATASSTNKIGLPKVVNDMVAQFGIREIAQCTPKDCTVVMFLCGLLQSTIQYLSISAAGKVLEPLLTMVGKGNSILIIQAMRTIDAFFIHAGELHLSQESSSLSTPDQQRAKEKFLLMAVQLINVLLTLKPHQQDQQATAAYVHTLKTGIVQFTSALEASGVNPTGPTADTLRVSYEKVPELLTLISGDLLSPKKEVVADSAKAVMEIIKKAVTRRMVESSLREAEQRAHMGSRQQAQTPPPFYRVIEWAENMLGYRFKVEWNRILLIVAELFHTTTGLPQAQSLLVPLLQKLDMMHNESMNETFTEDPTKDYRPALDEALGAAIQVFGMEQIVTILPLNLPTDYYHQQQKKGSMIMPLHEQLNRSRSWLLPLFRAYVGPSTFTFFIDFFLPISVKLHELEKYAHLQQKLMESKVWNNLKVGIWEIFPALCHELPKDLPQVIKNLAKKLVTDYLNVDEQLYTHSDICKGFSALIRKLKDRVKQGQAEGSLSQSDDHDVDEDEDDSEAKATFDDDLNDDDDEEEEEDVDSDDEEALAKVKAQRQAKKAAQAAQQKKTAALGTASSSSTSSNSSSTRRQSNFTPAESHELLTQHIAPLCSKLLPVFFNLAGMPSEKNKDVIFEAISQCASISEKELVNKNIKTVMIKLLEHTNKMLENKNQGADGEDGESMEDAGSSGNKGQQQQNLLRAHLLTDIIYSLVSQSSQSLSEENLEFLYQLIHNQLVPSVEGGSSPDDMDGALQKKFYKIFAILMSVPSFFDRKWKEFSADLQAGGSASPGALKARLSCLKIILLYLPPLMFKDKTILGLLPLFLGEVILASKDPKERTRDLAFDILISLGRKMVEVQNIHMSNNAGVDSSVLFGGMQNAASSQPLLAEYIMMVAGGLAGNTPHMQSASVLCLGRLIYEFKSIISPDITQTLLTAVLPMFEFKSRELIKSLLIFIKICILTFPSEILEQQTPGIVNGLVIWCAEKKQRFKLKIKVLFEILMKKLGVDFIRKLIPDKHTALIEHIRKQKEREKRLKAEAWQAKKGGAKDAEGGDGLSHKTLQDYDSIMKEADTEDAEMTDASSTGKKKKGGLSVKDANAMWIRDGDVDFMDPSVVSKVSSTNPALDSATRHSSIGYGHGVTHDPSTGKMKIAGTSTSATSTSSGAMIDIDELEGELKGKQREKRKRAEEEDEEEAEQTTKKQALPGAQFRSTKAGGDMKRRGQMDPYAFVPLDPSSMNKRKKFVAQRRLESVVNAAKHGAQTGSAIAKGHSRSHKNKSHKKHGHGH